MLGEWLDGETRITFHVLASRRKARPKLSLLGDAEVQDIDGHRHVALVNCGGRAYFKSAHFALRQYFAVQHPGGPLQRLTIKELGCQRSEVTAAHVLGRVSWLNDTFKREKTFWTRTAAAPAAAAVAEVAEPLENSLLAQLRANFADANVKAHADASDISKAETTGKHLLSSKHVYDSETDSVSETGKMDDAAKPLKTKPSTKVKKAVAKAKPKGKHKLVKLSKLAKPPKAVLAEFMLADVAPPALAAVVPPALAVAADDVPPPGPAADVPVELDPVAVEPAAVAMLPPAKVPKLGPHGAEWVKFEVLGIGVLVLDPYTHALSAHCPMHLCKKPKCVIEKALRKAPLGYLLAWLTIGRDEHGAHVHVDLKSRATRDAHFMERVELAKLGGLGKRRHSRLAHAERPELRNLFMLERIAYGLPEGAVVVEPDIVG